MQSKTYRQGVPSDIHGVGVFAIRSIRKGERIWCSRKGLERGFNQSCEPNVGNAGWHFKALKDIKVGEELTMSTLKGSSTNCNCHICRLVSPNQ